MKEQDFVTLTNLYDPSITTNILQHFPCNKQNDDKTFPIKSGNNSFVIVIP